MMGNAMDYAFFVLHQRCLLRIFSCKCRLLSQGNSDCVLLTERVVQHTDYYWYQMIHHSRTTPLPDGQRLWG